MADLLGKYNETGLGQTTKLCKASALVDLQWGVTTGQDFDRDLVTYGINLGRHHV
ncbi:MAG: hypothetical protein ABJL99_17420 [Aliishimia sp.]